MEEFKVGDRVKIIPNRNYAWRAVLLYNIGLIVEKVYTDAKGIRCYRITQSTSRWHGNELQRLQRIYLNGDVKEL